MQIPQVGNWRHIIKSLAFGLLGYWVITHIYPYTLLILYIYLVTLFHHIYNLLLEFNISLQDHIIKLNQYDVEFSDNFSFFDRIHQSEGGLTKLS